MEHVRICANCKHVKRLMKIHKYWCRLDQEVVSRIGVPCGDEELVEHLREPEKK